MIAAGWVRAARALLELPQQTGLVFHLFEAGKPFGDVSRLLANTLLVAAGWKKECIRGL